MGIIQASEIEHEQNQTLDLLPQAALPQVFPTLAKRPTICSVSPANSLGADLDGVSLKPPPVTHPLTSPVHPPFRLLPESSYFPPASSSTLWSSLHYLSSRLLPKL